MKFENFLVIVYETHQRRAEIINEYKRGSINEYKHEEVTECGYFCPQAPKAQKVLDLKQVNLLVANFSVILNSEMRVSSKFYFGVSPLRFHFSHFYKN